MATRSRITDRDDWFDLWLDDRESVLNTMVRNMGSDLSNGYDYFGKAIADQRRDIRAYKDETDRTLDMFKAMDEVAVSRWCFYDMKKRGAIE